MKITLALLVGIAFSLPSVAADDGAAFFETNIRPIFARQCMTCHSATAGMGGLKLDSRENILKGGSRGPALVPGKPAESLLLRAVMQTGELKMPPSGKLKDEDVARLGQWIQMDAPWGEPAQTTSKSAQKFWAFIAPSDPKVPNVGNRSWVKSPIDAFVLAGLEAKGLKPAPPADKRALIRRATFDLTGLPPTTAEVRAFLADSSPDAFARLVDRLLASPHYGERWGRHWLDVARYADSNGLDENLVYRHAWRYRDYVIQAFNKDKPYDQFVKEQLAGDLMPAADDATRFEHWTATAMLSLGAKMLAEDDPVKMEMDIVDEQVDTISRAFMGLTVGCARCHDHKFDPIPTADYYSMAGIFKSTKTMENFNVVARWNEHVLAPEPERRKLQEHLDKISAKTKEITRVSEAQNDLLATEGRAKVYAYLLAAADALRYAKIELKPIRSAAIEQNAESFARGNVSRKLEKEKSNVPEKSQGPYFAEYDVTAPSAGQYQLDVLEQEAGAGTADIWVNGALESRGKPAVSNREASPDAGGWSVSGVYPLHAGKNTIRFEHKSRFPYFEAFSLSPLPKNVVAPLSSEQVARQYKVNPGFVEQWAEEMTRSKGAPHSVLYALFAFEQKKSLRGDALAAWASAASVRFKGFEPKTREELTTRYQELFNEADLKWQQVVAARNADSSRPTEKIARNAVKQDEGLDEPALEAFRELSYAKAGPFRAPEDAERYYPKDVQDHLDQLKKERKALEDATPDLPKAMGVEDSEKVADLAINIRGSHWTLGEQVPRGFLRVLPGEKPPIPEGQSGRLQLAEWLVAPDHPLTSRVMVNRLWRWHFGRGIVPSTDNFGRLGEMPTNQPLLDWLALRFVEHKWSVKDLQRLIMLSSTYQMSSDYDEHNGETDPENALLWRFSRQRLEAEEIRDAVTAVTGEIDLKEGGTLLAYKDRQYVSDTSKKGGTDYDVARRAVYLPVVRSSMYEMFQAFDLPDPAVTNGDRNSTVIAPQALFMMNSSLVLKSTRAMAARLLARQDLDDAGRIREAYESALARPPEARDVDRALTFISQLEKAAEGHEPDAAKRHLASWQSFCKALLASNEFIYVN
jgi:cytochrome c553